MAYDDIKASINEANQGKVRVELRKVGDTQPFYVSSLLVAPFYTRLMKEKPFLAFIEIKQYAVTAKVVELQSDSVVIEWSYDGPDKFSEVFTHHPFLWEMAIEKQTGSVTE